MKLLKVLNTYWNAVLLENDKVIARYNDRNEILQVIKNILNENGEIVICKVMGVEKTINGSDKILEGTFYKEVLDVLETLYYRLKKDFNKYINQLSQRERAIERHKLCKMREIVEAVSRGLRKECELDDEEIFEKIMKDKNRNILLDICNFHNGYVTTFSLLDDFAISERKN